MNIAAVASLFCDLAMFFNLAEELKQLATKLAPR
jgi:hypothetical protein